MKKEKSSEIKEENNNKKDYELKTRYERDLMNKKEKEKTKKLMTKTKRQ